MPTAVPDMPEALKTIGPAAIVAALAEFDPGAPKWLPILVLPAAVLFGMAIGKYHTAVLKESASTPPTAWRIMMMAAALLLTAIAIYASGTISFVKPLVTEESDRAFYSTFKPGIVGWPASALRGRLDMTPRPYYGIALDDIENREGHPHPFVPGTRELATALIWFSFLLIPTSSAFIATMWYVTAESPATTVPPQPPPPP